MTFLFALRRIVTECAENRTAIAEDFQCSDGARTFSSPSLYLCSHILHARCDFQILEIPDSFSLLSDVRIGKVRLSLRTAGGRRITGSPRPIDFRSQHVSPL